jgi:hypothetical protein
MTDIWTAGVTRLANDIVSASDWNQYLGHEGSLDYLYTLCGSVFNVRSYGAVGNGVADDTSAIQAAITASIASGGAVYFPKGTYKICLTEGSYLGKYTGGKVCIVGQDATILDVSVYTNGGPFTQIIWLSGTTEATITGLNYVGPAVLFPGTNVGYIGASFVRATSGATNITVNAYVENARHGIHSGDYTDVSLGACSVFRGNLVTKIVGYPIATYLADDIEMSISSEKSHRTAYIAGCHHLRLNAQFKDQYVGDVQVLLTDAMTAPGASKGCSDCKVSAVDMGSTIFTSPSWCAGISLSRVDPGTIFQDIELHVYVKSSDTVATQIGGVIVNSTVTLTLPAYTFNWEPTIRLSNIKIFGTLDRSGQTLPEHSVGEIYIYTEDNVDPSHFGTVQGLNVENFVYLPGSGAKPRGFWFFVPGLVGTSVFSNCDFGTTTPFGFASNTTSKTSIVGCRLRGSYFADVDPYLSAITFTNCIIADFTFQPTDSYKVFFDGDGVTIPAVVQYANNAAAVLAGLPIGTLYRITGTDALAIVHA